MDLVNLDIGENPYKYIAHQLKKLAGDSTVIVASMDEVTDSFVVQAVESDIFFRNAANEALGRELVGASFKAAPWANQLLASDRLVQIEGGLHQLSLGEITKDRAAILESRLGIGQIYTAGFITRGKLLGLVAVIVGQDSELANRDALEAFVSQATVALHRHQAEESLIEANERLEALVRASPIAITVLDPEIRVKLWNPAAECIFGWEEKELLDKPLPTVPEDRQDEHQRLIARVLKGETILGWESCRQRKDGCLIDVRISASPFRGNDGRLFGIVVHYSDITEQKRLQEQLLRARLLETAGKVAGQVAHDFNNLLSPLISYSELMKMELPEGHPAQRYCNTMIEAASRMAEINADMLVLGRRGNTIQEAIDINRLVLEALAQRSRYSETLTYDLDLAPDLPLVAGAPAQLSRVLSNLISNAEDAMQGTGTLSVKTDVAHKDGSSAGTDRQGPGKWVLIQVSDTGCGIPPEHQDKVFQAFFTTKQTGRWRGSGLGLSVVQAVVEDHGGWIDLKSVVGKGSTFMVYLPPAPEGTTLPAHSELKGGTERILVADDDPMQREVATRLLVKMGYQVDSVGSGKDALKRLQESPVDLLVLDVVMPGGIDGPETYRQALEIRPSQRAVMISGFAESERLHEAARLGAGEFLLKPISLRKLAQLVRRELDR